jgi:hypothetical protein
MVQPTAPPSVTHRLKATIVSLLFWGCLFAGAGLYTLVVLSPKLVERQRLQDDDRRYQLELVSQESRLLRLNGVADALQNDPEFAGELARIHLKARGAGEETIPVGEEFAFRLALDEKGETRLDSAAQTPWYLPAVSVVAENDAARGVVLLTAVVLVLFAFTFLNDSLIDLGLLPGWSRVKAHFCDRYARSDGSTSFNSAGAPLLNPDDDPED